MIALILGREAIEGEVYRPAVDGRIVWVDDEVIGYMCGCGSEELLTLGIYKDDPTECECGAKLYYEIEIVVKEVS